MTPDEYRFEIAPVNDGASLKEQSDEEIPREVLTRTDDMDDGRSLVQAANEHYRGGPDAPFSRDDLLEKFNDCASLVLNDTEAATLFTAVESLEKITDIRQLVQKLVPQSTTSSEEGS